MVVIRESKTIQENAMNHGTKTAAHPELSDNSSRDEGHRKPFPRSFDTNGHELTEKIGIWRLSA